MESKSGVKKSKIITFTITIIALLFGVGVACFSWYSCRDFCTNLFLINKDIIVSKLLVYLGKFLVVILLFLVFKGIQKILIENLLKRLIKRVNYGSENLGLIKFCNFCLWLLFTFIILSYFVGDVSALLASLGLIGFGLTFALQKPILNFVGWLTIIFKKIYSEGDRIRIGDVIGDVKEVQLMNTVLDGILENSNILSGKVTTFPNELVLTSGVQNYTKESNYILQELKISITYESDYHKAINLLNDIIIKLVNKNSLKYIKQIKAQEKQVNKFIQKLVSKKVSLKLEDDEAEDAEALRLNHEKEKIKKDISSLEDEFKPQIRVNMLDSAIELLAQYKCPYKEVLAYKTEINLAFLDAIAKDNTISVAYPHMQIVKSDSTKTKLVKK
ncbi:mechanosensitive ion channel family protein [Candidatus Woesearchaeota archaeon]|nr:mechanosensitive ion channel family protein [Candidatus Woesearchaeota archaeon]MCF8014072.1 mechanosensitive ion channel family protein [Candidatus Woesearchaeota archaeon]